MYQLCIYKIHVYKNRICSARLIVGFLLAIFSIGVLAEPYSWKLEKDDEGIKIYTATIDGSDFRAFRASMTVTATLNQVVAMHVDPDTVSEWLYDCKKSELIKKVKENEYYIYYVSDAPWPVQDRDYVLHSTITQNPDNHIVTINFDAVTDYMETSDECVRMAKVAGYWRFEPKSGGKVYIEYQVHADPNGAIPAWLANSAVVEQPFETMKTIRVQMLKQKYVEADVAFITEPEGR